MAPPPSLLATALLLLLLAIAGGPNAAAVAEAVRYQTLVATPLSTHPYTATAVEDDGLFQGSLAADEGGAAASTVGLRVVHRDDFG